MVTVTSARYDCYLTRPPDGPEADAPYDWDDDDAPPDDPPIVPAGWIRGPAVFLGEPVAATADDLAGRGFREGGLADTLPPGPSLVALASAAADNPRGLSDDEMLGAISAARRQQAYAEWMELRQVAAFARLQEERFEASKSRSERQRYHEGEFGAEELHFQLNISRQAARAKMDLALNLDDRLPKVFAWMRDGRIDAVKARHIHRFTAPLDRGKAAIADKILAEAAPDLTEKSVYAKARRVCYKLDPELFDRLREEAARDHQRVEVAQEDSGNARVSMREMAVADAAAIKASLDDEAVRLKNAGLDAPLRQIRFWIARDRALGLDPWERLITSSGPPGDNGRGGQRADGAQFPADDGYREHDETDEGRPGGKPPFPGGGKAPLPGLLNIIVTDGALLGWSDALGEAGGWGLLAPDQIRELVEAASLHPRTRWCVTLVNKDGEAIAHGCARGRHPWNLMRARTATCPAPGCEAQALYNETDHTEPWPHGRTDECNLSPPCGRHHHAKHAPGWQLEQAEPGVMTWTTPSGRTFTTTPTRYDR